MRKLFIIYVLFFTIIFHSEQANSYAFSLVPNLVRIALSASTVKKIAYPIAAAVGVYEGQKMYNVWSLITETKPMEFGSLELTDVCTGGAKFYKATQDIIKSGLKYYKIVPTGNQRWVNGSVCSPLSYGRLKTPSSSIYIYSHSYSDTDYNLEPPITYHYYNEGKLEEVEYDDDTVERYEAEILPESEIKDASGANISGADLLDELELKWDESLAQQARRISDAIAAMTGTITDAINNARPEGLSIQDVSELVDAAPPAYDPYKDIPITGPVPPIDVPADPDDPTIPVDPTLPIDPPVITPPVTPTVPLLPDGSVPVTTQNPPNINVTVDMPEEIAIKDVSVPALPFFEVPALPEFDTSVDMPEEKDWLKPVRDFVSNIMSSLPFLSMFESASINGSGSSSVSFDVLNHTFYFDFSDYESFFSYLGTVLIFISSIKAVFIVVRGD